MLDSNLGRFGHNKFLRIRLRGAEIILQILCVSTRDPLYIIANLTIASQSCSAMGGALLVAAGPKVMDYSYRIRICSFQQYSAFYLLILLFVR